MMNIISVSLWLIILVFETPLLLDFALILHKVQLISPKIALNKIILEPISLNSKTSATWRKKTLS